MTVKEAINTRYTCRYYQSGIEISQHDIDCILSAGQKAPNGFGLEPWNFLVITGNYQKLYAATNQQQHIQDAGLVLALVNFTTKYVIDNPQLIINRFAQIGMSAEKSEAYLNAALAKGTQYFREQLMFVAGQMVLQATELGIGSTIVGGFDPDKVGEILGLEPEYFQVGLLISFGYPREETTKPRIHRSLDDITNVIRL